MNNAEKLQTAFVSSLGIDPSVFSDELTYQSVPEWDSVGHVMLVSELEESFNVMLDTDEIIDMSSPAKAREILTRHGVTF